MSSLENQRRRPVSVITSSRLADTSDLSVWSSIDTSRSLQRDREPRLSPTPREGGIKTTLTMFLAAVMDLFSRKIIGWAMQDHMQVELASAALTMAINQQRPQTGLIHHSDRGVQYASHAYRKVLTGAGIVASMSRKADCYDNAPMESFFHTLKTELVHHRDYNTRAEAQRDIFAFIEGFYNRTRLHSAIGYVAPIEMELKAA
nr:IS3 family transposase [Bradyrhizobium sp. 147]